MKKLKKPAPKVAGSKPTGPRKLVVEPQPGYLLVEKYGGCEVGRETGSRSSAYGRVLAAYPDDPMARLVGSIIAYVPEASYHCGHPNLEGVAAIAFVPGAAVLGRYASSKAPGVLLPPGAQVRIMGAYASKLPLTIVGETGTILSYLTLIGTPIALVRLDAEQYATPADYARTAGKSAVDASDRGWSICAPDLGPVVDVLGLLTVE